MIRTLGVAQIFETPFTYMSYYSFDGNVKSLVVVQIASQYTRQVTTPVKESLQRDVVIVGNLPTCIF